MMSRKTGFARDLAELISGYGLLMLALWTPGLPRGILAPIALLATLAIVLARRPTLDQLGLGRRGPYGLTLDSSCLHPLRRCQCADRKAFGTLHALYKADFQHIPGYVLWTLYQQFLLDDYFHAAPQADSGQRQHNLESRCVAVRRAHLPNLPLTAATLVWGAMSCALFLRYRNLCALVLPQGLLGLCFAVCIPDALHHHLKVGLGYIREFVPPAH